MATNIDKALYQQPQGIDSLAEAEAPLEIEIVDPEEVNISMGDLDISIQPAEDDEFNLNLAEDITGAALESMASDLADDISNDKASRKEWEKTYVDGLKLLGLQYEERTEPWNGASGVFHPMITEAVVRFQSETITETFPAAGPVRTKIIGKETPQKLEASKRVAADMNYQLTDVMKEFRPEHERMLWSLPAAGSAFKKVYFDPNMGRQVSMFLPAEDIILPYGTTDMDTCYRLTHVMRKTKNEIIKLQRAGFYLDIELPDPTREQTDIEKAKDKETGFSDLNDERYVLMECHVDLDLPGYEDLDDDGEMTGIALPYVVTLIKGTNDVLSIRRNWNQGDDLRLKRQHFVHYQYIPGFGAYGFGLFHLIGGFAKSATSIMRQLVDAGTLSNLPGGLKSRGLRIKGDDTPIAPGEFRDVDVSSGTLRDSILPLPYKEPSQVLFQLLGTIVEEGRRFAATADMKVADMSANAPVGTTLALLERQLKVMSAVQARLHYSFKQELHLLAGLIRDYTDEAYDYEPDNGTRRAKAEDYAHVDIIPVSDPNAATMSQRVVQYQAVIQMAQMAPTIYDQPYLHRQMLEVLGIPNAEKLVKLDDEEKPRDPVSENMSILNGKPVKAFIYQDHEAHITVHTSAMQDPKIAKLMGQNPQAQSIMAAGAAHVQEHLAFAYRKQLEEQAGVPYPAPDAEMSEETETQVSRLAAAAAQQLLQKNQAEAAQQQAQQTQQDPIVQMQQKEIEIKQQEVQIKQQELQIKQQEAQARQQLAQQDSQLKQQKATDDATTKAGQLDIDRQRIATQERIANLQLDAKTLAAKEAIDAQHHLEGARLGVDIAKNRAEHARKQTEVQTKGTQKEPK